MKVFFGWKFYNFILIPKNFDIPKLSEVEIMLLLLKQLNKKDKNINDIVKLIINKFSLSNKFIILDNPQHILTKYENYLNRFDEIYAGYIEKKYDKSFRTSLLNDINLVIIEYLYENSEITYKKYSDYLHKISEITNKKYNLTQILILKIDVSPMLPIKFENILYIPYFYYSIKEDSKLLFHDISVKKKLFYKNYTLLDLSIDNEIQIYIQRLLNLKNRITENILCGGFIHYERTIQIIYAISDLNLLNTFIIESSYNKLESYECAKILYLNAPPLVKPSLEIILEFNEANREKNIDETKRRFYDMYNNLKIRSRNEFLKCNYIIDNKLKVKLDNKINLKKYFNDKSILPLTFNIGKIDNLLSECERNEILSNIEHNDYITAIVEKIIKFLRNFCNLNKNKYFIIKDAKGTGGINISGFNCFDDYDKVNYEKKIDFLRKLFYNEIETYDDYETSIKKHVINYIECLNKNLVIQEFIISPKIFSKSQYYNFKSRIFIIINQQKSQNDNISQLYSYLYKQFSPDLMEYKEVNPNNFFNEDYGTYDSFISNKNEHLEDLSYTDDIKNFVQDEIVKEFINKFNIYINKINKFVNGIFIDDNNNFINSNIYKILVIDAIFDINDHNNIKIIEINTEGAVYLEDLEINILKLIYNNDDSSFIKADTTFNYDEEVTYSEDLDDIYCINKFNETKDSSLKFKNKYLKYKNKYLKYKNNL
jgi:hypothetical protein